MSFDELLEHVPPEVVYRRAPLPDQQNAVGPWRETVCRFVKPKEGSEEHDLWLTLIYGKGDSGEPAHFPCGQDGRALRELLKKNRAALALLREGIQRGRLQLPETRWPPATGEDAILVWRLQDVTQAVFIKAKALCTDLDFGGVAEELVGMLRMGEMICNGEGDIGEYLVGDWIRSSALRSIRTLAARREVPLHVLTERLSAAENSLRSRDGLAECLRVELCCTGLPQLDHLVPCDELETFVDRLLATCYWSQPMDPDETVPDDDRVQWRRGQILSLLQGHPQPFDKLATVRLLGESVAQWIEELNRPPRPRVFDVVGQWRRFRRWDRGRWWWRHTRFWPKQLRPDFPFEWMGTSDDARGKLAALPEELEGFDEKTFASMQPPTEVDVLSCRRRLRRVANPVGLILVMHLMPIDVSHFMFRYRAALHETRSVLTNRLND